MNAMAKFRTCQKICAVCKCINKWVQKCQPFQYAPCGDMNTAIRQCLGVCPDMRKNMTTSQQAKTMEPFPETALEPASKLARQRDPMVASQRDKV